MGNQSSHQPLERGHGFRLSRKVDKKDKSPSKRMDRLRRSFRDSFRRRKDPHVPESSKPHQWASDEHGVRAGTCQFQVKYLGCVEVYDSRGMQVCEEALKVLRNSKRRPIRATLHISGDGLRVVEDETKGLIVDQTIEKVSFCAPDKNHEKGFSYICRDGTTKRWMCHGFLALKESGDRLSHAVGCAFAACLERKQRRDKECGVTMTFDHRTSTFTRTGSFRQQSLTERMQDPRERAIDVPQAKPVVHNPFAIERPHATPSMLERQGSFRGFNQLNQASPFKRSNKRQMSLRVNDLPSNLERTRSHSLEPSDLSRLPFMIPNAQPIKPSEYNGYDEVSPIPEISPTGHDSVSAMCQHIARGLSMLSSSDDCNTIVTHTTTNTNSVVKKLFSSNLPIASSSSLDDLHILQQNGSSSISTTSSGNNNSSQMENREDKCGPTVAPVINWHEKASPSPVLSSNHRLTPILNQVCNLSPVLPRTTTPVSVINSSSIMSTPVPPPLPPVCTIASVFETPAASPAFSTASTSSLSSSKVPQQIMNRSPVPLSSIAPSIESPMPSARITSSSPVPSHSSEVINTPSMNLNPVATIPITEIQPVSTSISLPRPDQWLGSITSSVPIQAQATSSNVPPIPSPRRAPALHARAHTSPDPFDAGWADIRQSSATNPFILPSTTQAFQVQL